MLILTGRSCQACLLMTEVITKTSVEISHNKMSYTVKITDAKKEFSLPDNDSYLDIWFEILKDGEVVAERRLAFPLGTTEEMITAELKAYCQMYENDYALAEQAAKKAEAEAEAESVLSDLKDKEIA